MERITKWALRNKAAIIVLVVLVLVMGIVSYFTLPKEFLPVADNPQVTVTVLGQGLDAQSIVSQVTDPIEKAVGNVKGKTDVMSTTADGWAKVDINFDSKTNMKDAKNDVQNAISGLTFPDGVSRPQVIQLNTSMIPIADVTLTFRDGLTQTNSDLVKNKISPLFQTVQGVGSVSTLGEDSTKVVIHADKAKLAQDHIPFNAIMLALQGKNLTATVGSATMNNDASTIQVIGKVDSLDTLQNILVAGQVKLKDIATVDTVRSMDSITRVDGHDAMALFISKDGNSNAVTVGKKVQSVIDQINHDYSPAVHANLAFATADMVLNSVNGMMREVLMGALFATVVILLFLRSIRLTLITIVSIPLSLGLTLFLLSESGVTLNILTLGAVAVAVGRLVDDSIVVIENIYRRSQISGLSKDIVIDATREVATAITSSTLTTVAVFLPIGLVQGQLQSFMLPFALSVVYSLLSSLVVALTVVPLLGTGMLKSVKLRQHKRPVRYTRFLGWMLSHKWIPLVLAAGVFAGTVFTYLAMPKGAMDTSNMQMVAVQLTYPSTTPAEQVKAGAYQLESLIDQQPQKDTSILVLGNSSQSASYGQLSDPNQAQFSVVMKKGANADDFITTVNAKKSQFPGADLNAFASSGWGGGNTINLDLMGNSTQDLLSASNQVIQAVKNFDGVQQVTANAQNTKPTYRIVVDPTTANAQEVSQQLRAMFNQLPVGTMRLNGQDTPVLLDNFLNPTSASDLSNIMVSTKTGMVPLSQIATVQKTDQASTVLRKNGDEYVRVSVQVDPKKVSAVNKQIALKTKSMSLPAGVTLNTGGAAAQMSGDFTDLGKTMLASIGLVYLIMVLTFKTLRAPLAILFSLPLAAVGAVLGLLVTGTPADTSSLIGMLMLIGIVVTNAIVLLDRVKQNERHMNIREAILEAAGTRMRPILMTAAATVSAMLPVLFSNPEAGSLVSKSLAVVVIGGLTISTLLSLIVVPVVYELLFFRKSKKQRVAAAQAAFVS